MFNFLIYLVGLVMITLVVPFALFWMYSRHQHGLSYIPTMMTNDLESDFIPPDISIKNEMVYLYSYQSFMNHVRTCIDILVIVPSTLYIYRDLLVDGQLQEVFRRLPLNDSTARAYVTALLIFQQCPIPVEVYYMSRTTVGMLRAMLLKSDLQPQESKLCQ